jgi:homoserine kinase
MALALSHFLDIEAHPANGFSIEATGWNADICSRLTQNLLIETYEAVLATEGKQIRPLAIRMQNGIPIGKGCGSSAAVRLAGVALASAFGDLGWSRVQILERAANLEGHPDNVAACWQGGLSVVVNAEPIATLTIQPPSGWSALVVAPEIPLSTSKARSALPLSYSREDVVSNLQCASMLTAAFALGRADLMGIATNDRLHQPYRMELCPLLPALRPLTGTHGVMSVTLSGAGPSVLLLVHQTPDEKLKQNIRERSKPLCAIDILLADLCPAGALMEWRDHVPQPTINP